MLRVSVHAGLLGGVARCNRTDWVDIGYAHLDALADYKVTLFNIDVGATAPVVLYSYPRWSASLWDLVARAIAKALCPALDNAEEVAPPLDEPQPGAAFADAVSAVIEHLPTKGLPGRRLGAMEVLRQPRTRALYRARVEEDLQPSARTPSFTFTPRVLRPAELVMRAAMVRMSGHAAVLPPRPALRLPIPQLRDGKPYVAVRQLPEPARTGFMRWLHRRNEASRAAHDVPDGLAPEALFTRFLREAV